jgi:hypothetical protein
MSRKEAEDQECGIFFFPSLSHLLQGAPRSTCWDWDREVSMSPFEIENGVSIVVIEVGGREKSRIRSGRSSWNIDQNSEKPSINKKKQQNQQLLTSSLSLSLSLPPSISCTLQP